MPKKNGFSLVEVMVAAVLFSVVILGLTSSFVAGNKHIVHNRERATSAQLGKFFLDPLQTDVRFDTWDTTANSLYIPAPPVGSFTTYCDAVAGHESLQNPLCPSDPDDRKVNNRVFSTEYEVSRVMDGATDTGLRRVKTKITWDENL